MMVKGVFLGEWGYFYFLPGLFLVVSFLLFSLLFSSLFLSFFFLFFLFFFFKPRPNGQFVAGVPRAPFLVVLFNR